MYIPSGFGIRLRLTSKHEGIITLWTWMPESMAKETSTESQTQSYRSTSRNDPDLITVMTIDM